MHQLAVLLSEQPQALQLADAQAATYPFQR